MTNLPRPALFPRAIAITMAAAATLVIVAGSAAPASAATATPRTAVIALSGIDLASRAGEARVADDVTRAARQVCSEGGDRALAASRARRACVENAIATAMPQLAQRVDAARSARTALAGVSRSTALAGVSRSTAPAGVSRPTALADVSLPTAIVRR